LRMSPAALEALVRYDFPGNVRQLQNLVERLGILAENAEITASEVELALPTGADVQGTARKLYRQGHRLLDLVRDAERVIIEEAISAHDRNKAAAARSLKV